MAERRRRDRYVLVDVHQGTETTINSPTAGFDLWRYVGDPMETNEQGDRWSVGVIVDG